MVKLNLVDSNNLIVESAEGKDLDDAAGELIKKIREKGTHLPQDNYTIEDEEGNEYVYRKVVARPGFGENWVELYHVIAPAAVVDGLCLEYIRKFRTPGNAEFKTKDVDGTEVTI